MREVKVFILGLPGCGKSTAARHIQRLGKGYGWSTIRFNDYDILHEMFQADLDRKQFWPTAHNGFDVHDLSVFDTALEKLETKVQQRECLLPRNNELVINEFARDNYCESLKCFSKSFLHNAYFLFLDVDIETCKQRIRERVVHPVTPDDYFVSEFIFDSYYQYDNRQYMSCNFASDYGIDERNVEVIDNQGSQEELLKKVADFVDPILTKIPIFA